MYIKLIMSRVPTRVGGGGGGLTLVIFLVLMMCVSVIVGAGGYVLFKPKKPVVPKTPLKTLTAAEKTKAADDAQAAADALAADPDATPAEVAAAQAAAAAAADDTDAPPPPPPPPPPDPINCVGSWPGWGACSETCGGGLQSRTWATITEPLHGGTVCPSPSTETQACNEQACPIGDNGFDNETFYIKDVEDRYVGAYGARNIMGHGYWYPKASYTLDGSLDETTIQSGGKYCLGFDNRINCSGGSGDDRGNFKLEKQSDGGFKIYNEGLGAYIGLTKDVLYKEIDKAKYPDDKQNMILYLERVP